MGNNTSSEKGANTYAAGIALRNASTLKRSSSSSSSNHSRKLAARAVQAQSLPPAGKLLYDRKYKNKKRRKRSPRLRAVEQDRANRKRKVIELEVTVSGQPSRRRRFSVSYGLDKIHELKNPPRIPSKLRSSTTSTDLVSPLDTEAAMMLLALSSS
ncbi:hypothetical protein K493DRAFT_310235 [Basidiobolus meristosporus CBS 931.73]|uniref:Uncharacterized protein n=1 Tax=Basidiobolus meristosporus CBS 931.73 TaxID=1314790 RepID=A0A1Y1ZCH0_9FUNG|nr:hypothetical protein K493DRAFT_310235 [Basidiobolus meristosporus CBS 931.73]|eukprot:ORY07505.1 hypothetical protein K493DRAFT_310235 [Basidiobolus meristosporus CBS 931.73]